MTEPQELSFLSLPDDMLRVIAEYCDLTTRCAVTCTNSTVPNSVLLGRVALSKDGSERFLKDKQFRLRIHRRVLTPDRSIHLQVDIKEIKYEPHINILNSVRSVFLYTAKSDWNSLWFNQLPPIQTLTGLTNLTGLDLSKTRVTDVSALAALTNLTKLSLCATRVSDVSALAVLTNLTSLILYSTGVSDVSALAGLKNVTHLHLHNTQVSDVSALAGLTNLTYLNLDSTQVTDVSAFAGLAELRINL